MAPNDLNNTLINKEYGMNKFTLGWLSHGRRRS